MATGDGTNFSTSPLMALKQPTVGVCGALGTEPAGASWLELINASLSLLDSHTHAPGFGAQVPASGLSINADVSWGQNNLTSLRSARFSAIALGTVGASDLGCLLVSGADLYYVDTAGNQIRLTSGGGVAGTPGSIAGLVSPAAASYTPASKLFALTSSSGFAANLSSGPLSIGDATISAGKAATISVPAGLAANYNLSLPAALPAAKSFLTLDNVGAIAAGPNFSGGLTTAHLSAAAGILGSQLAAAAGILGAQLADATITSAKIAAATIARSNLTAVGQQVSASCGSFSTASTSYVDVTNLTVTLTTGGRPVMVVLQPDTTGTPAFCEESGGGNQTMQVALLRDGAVIASWKFQVATGTGDVIVVGSAMAYLDAPSAAAHTYKIQALTTPSGGAAIQNYVLAAYEL